MNHLPARIRETVVILPTSDWFDDVRQYDASLHYFRMNLNVCMVTTLKLLIRTAKAAQTSNKKFRYMSVSDYSQNLTGTLMEENAKNRVKHSSDALAVVVEVSTHFYKQLIEYFKSTRLEPDQLASMLIKGWVDDDLIVGIKYLG